MSLTQTLVPPTSSEMGLALQVRADGGVPLRVPGGIRSDKMQKGETRCLQLGADQCRLLGGPHIAL